MAAKTQIQFLDNGPAIATGEFEIVDPSGKALVLDKPGRAALCRCGQSSKKPFCDGTHKTCGFKSEIKA